MCTVHGSASAPPTVRPWRRKRRRVIRVIVSSEKPRRCAVYIHAPWHKAVDGALGLSRGRRCISPLMRRLWFAQCIANVSGIETGNSAISIVGRLRIHPVTLICRTHQIPPERKTAEASRPRIASAVEPNSEQRGAGCIKDYLLRAHATGAGNHWRACACAGVVGCGEGARRKNVHRDRARLDDCGQDGCLAGAV
jgi:hypothetical protein